MRVAFQEIDGSICPINVGSFSRFVFFGGFVFPYAFFGN
jgi:hypothetical protein